MDRDQFDSLARAISGTSSRRRFNALLLGLGVGSSAGLSLLGGDDAEARNKQKAKRRRARKRKKGKKADQGGGTGGGPVREPQCVPDCTGFLGPKECGSDGCGGVCGQCPILLPICSNVTFTCGPIV